MKIAYDLSFLAAPGSDDAGRTGIGRAVAELAAALLRQPECEMHFHALSWNDSAMKMAAKEFCSPQATFHTSRLRSIAGEHFAAVDRFIGATMRNRSLVLRAARRCLHLYARTCEGALARGLRPALQEADIYHSPFFAIPSWIKRCRSRPRFTTVYDLIALRRPELFEHHMVRNIERLVAGFDPSDWIQCISEATRNDLLVHARDRVDPARVFVTPLAASPSFHPEGRPDVVNAVRRRYGLPAGSRYILSVSTLEARKNVQSVVRAFLRLVRCNADHADLHLALVGKPGWKSQAFAAAIEDAGELRSRIHTTGYVAECDLAALYSGATAFVYLSEAEGFGLPPLEAMQCGTPVIVSNCSSLPEVVGAGGILVDPHDVETVRQHLEEICGNAELRETLGRAARQRATMFSWERSAAEMASWYRRALAEV